MAGKLLRLHGVTINNPTAPKIITRDKMESSGSLMLFDGNHDFGKFVGLPAMDAIIPNALSNFTKALTGGNGTDIDFKVKIARPNSTQFKSERTPKGGIHGIVTQAGSQNAAEAYTMDGPKAVSDYILANPTHQYYFSMWSVVTRPGLTTPAAQSPFHFTNGLGATTNHLFHMQGGIPSPGYSSAPSFRGMKAVPTYTDHTGASIVVPMKRFGSVGIQGFVGNSPIPADRIQLGVGTFGGWNNLNWNVSPSRIIYRAYGEDLTKSGRSYAEVEALDYALFLEAFAAGGKFFGDTYTAPSTLP